MILNFLLFLEVASTLLVYLHTVGRFQFSSLSSSFHLFGVTITNQISFKPLR